MPATLKNVQWLTIQEAADMWHEHLLLPKTTIVRELRFGWYKWAKEKAGVAGYRCGTPLKVRPREADLPAMDQDLEWNFLEQFSIKQGWRMPEHWKASLSGPDRYPGRPSVRRAMEQKLRELYEKGELRESLSEQATVLRSWADKEFPVEQVPAKGTIENQIRNEFRELRRKLNRQEPTKLS